MHYNQDFDELIDVKFDEDILDSETQTIPIKKKYFEHVFDKRSSENKTNKNELKLLHTVRSNMQNGNEKCELESLV